jgi:lipopolysaccharide export system protein LptC
MLTQWRERAIYPIVALFALLSWLLLEYTGVIELMKPKKQSGTPDYFSTGYRKWEMDETGKLKSRLTAAKMSHYPAVVWATHTEKPVLEFVYADKPSWIIHSETGKLSKDGKNLALDGKAVIHRPAAPGFREITINTMNLKVKPETSYAETDAWAELLSPPNITTGKGLKAVFKEPINLELLANVKGKYETNN